MKRHIRYPNDRGALCANRDGLAFAAALDDVTCNVCRHKLVKHGVEEVVARAVVALIEDGEIDFAREILLHKGSWSGRNPTVYERISEKHLSLAHRAEALRRAVGKAANVIHARASKARRAPASERKGSDGE